MMSGTFWLFLKDIFGVSKRDPSADALAVDVSSESARDATKIEVADVSHTEPRCNALTALPFYDENLLDCCITQWKFGAWHSLIKITKEQLEHHPDREKLAILVAAGHFQIGALTVAKEFTQTAITWGCSQRLVSQILIAGVHNSLGRAAVLSQESDRALEHFKEAITIGAPKSEVTLFVQARATEQIRQTTAQLLANSEA